MGNFTLTSIIVKKTAFNMKTQKNAGQYGCYFIKLLGKILPMYKLLLFFFYVRKPGYTIF